MKKYILPVLYTVLALFIFSLLITILSYFDITNENINKILTFISGLVAIFIGSFKFSKENNLKPVISSLLFYGIFILVIAIINIISIKNININITIYYISLLISSLIAGYIGNKRKREKN